MEKGKNIIKNYLYNVVYQVFAVIAPLVTLPYVSRVLGATGIGTLSYADSIAQYFILVGALGSNLYGQREIAYVQNDPYKRTKVFLDILSFRIFTVGISTILYFLICCRTGEYRNVFLILIFEVFGAAFDISWFFQGIEDFKKAVTRNVIIKALSIVLTFVFVRSENDVLLYAICYAVPIFISNISLWFYMPKYMVKVKRERLISFSHVMPLLILFIPQIATEIYTVLDKTMIGMISSNMNQVGYYEQSQKVIKVLLYFVTALGTVMLPRISNLFATGKTEEIKENINKSFRFVFLTAVPLMFGISAVSSLFVPVFYGSGYDSIIPLLRIISPITLAIGISNIIGRQFLIPTKQQKAFTISVCSGALINFALNMVLIRKYDAIGASIASVIAEVTVMCVQLWFVRNELNLELLIKPLIKYIMLGAVMFFVVFAFVKFLPISVVSLAISVLIGAFVYLVELILSKDEMIWFLINVIKKKQTL